MYRAEKSRGRCTKYYSTYQRRIGCTKSPTELRSTWYAWCTIVPTVGCKYRILRRPVIFFQSLVQSTLYPVTLGGAFLIDCPSSAISTDPHDRRSAVCSVCIHSHCTRQRTVSATHVHMHMIYVHMRAAKLRVFWSSMLDVMDRHRELRHNTNPQHQQL